MERLKHPQTEMSDTIHVPDEAALPVKIAPNPLDGGPEARVARVIHDISRLNLAAEEFRGSEAVFQLMLNNIKDYAIMMLDPEGYVITWNAGSRLISGYETEEIIGKYLSVFYLPSDVETGKPARDLATASSTGRLAEQGWRLRKDGTSFWADVVLTAMRDPAGRLLGFAKVKRDMSERRRAEMLDAVKTADLIVANKELESFAYSVSHDLRAPLRHMDGFAGLLRANCYQQIDDKGKRCLDKITAAAQRMGCLIDDLLAFSRLLRSDVSQAPVNLQELQEGARSDLEPDYAGRRVIWTIGNLPQVIGDRAMLRQVFFNLLSNALKFTRDQEEAHIEIGCAGTTAEETTIFVRDNGSGFDMQYVGKLFGVFQRLHSEHFEGTGIGLANVRRIIERHGGRVWAQGTVDNGATFYFSLPGKKGIEHG